MTQQKRNPTRPHTRNHAPRLPKGELLSYVLPLVKDRLDRPGAMADVPVIPPMTQAQVLASVGNTVRDHLLVPKGEFTVETLRNGRTTVIRAIRLLPPDEQATPEMPPSAKSGGII